MDDPPAESELLSLSEIEGCPPPSVLILHTDDSRNLSLCREAAAIGSKHIVALVNDASRLSEFQNLGVQTFAPVMYRATILALMACNPELFGILSSAREDHQIREITFSNPRAVGSRIQDLSLKGDILILSIRRGTELLIPHGNTRLKIGDRLTALGSLDSIADLIIFLENRQA